MLKNIKEIFISRAMRRRSQTDQASIEAWTLHFGREGAELWVEAIAVRDAVRLSNA